MFRKLLLPLDRSSLAEQAIGHAASIARESGAAIDIVLVHEPFPFAGYADLPWEEETDAAAEQKYLEAVADELKSGAQVTATCAVLRGAPADMIIRRAREVGADLIVMTSHGRTGLSRTWLGSVADAVMRKSAIPVFMLRPERESETTKRRVAARGVKRILVPMDGSALAGGIVPAATDLARAAHASITLLRVVPIVPIVMAYEPTLPVTSLPVVPDEAATQQLVDLATTELESAAQRLHAETGIAIDSHVVVSGHAAQAIVDQAEALKIDVIAMSTHGRGASRLLLGSVADKVLRSSRVPVLLYRPVEVRATTLTLDEAEVVRQLPSLMPD
jgi:nucleotide-binding universal stress UspA family protein